MAKDAPFRPSSMAEVEDWFISLHRYTEGNGPRPPRIQLNPGLDAETRLERGWVVAKLLNTVPIEQQPRLAEMLLGPLESEGARRATCERTSKARDRKRKKGERRRARRVESLKTKVRELIVARGLSDRAIVDYFARLADLPGGSSALPRWARKLKGVPREYVREAREALGYTPGKVAEIRDRFDASDPAE